VRRAAAVFELLSIVSWAGFWVAVLVDAGPAVVLPLFAVGFPGQIVLSVRGFRERAG
jgi:hypothetical protein